MTPIRRIRTGAVVLAAVFCAAVLGYRLFFERDWVNSLYMVVITISSVGYTDSAHAAPHPYEQLFTVMVILVGMSAAAYTFGGVVQIMAEGEIARVMGQHRLTKEIANLSGHVIICGHGRMGQLLAQEMHLCGTSFVVVDVDTQRMLEANQRGFLGITGDATEEDVLIDAGVRRAKSLVTVLPNDAANVFITLTSRNLNPALQIIARAEYASSEKKLKQAGADRVVMPATIGATQMSRLITRPTTADLIELLSDVGELEIELDEVHVLSEGHLAGVSVQQAEAHRRHRLLVVAVKQESGEMVFNPGGDYVFAAGDTLILMGGRDDIARFAEEYHLRR